MSVLLPTLILTKGHLFISNPLLLFGLAISFPIILGLHDFIVNRNVNIISILGFIGAFITGSIGFLHLGPKWLALKEAFIPLSIGLVVYFSKYSKTPIVETFLGEVLDFNKIHEKLDCPLKKKTFRVQLMNANTLIALSFLISSILNYILTTHIVKADTGTALFNQELGKLTLLSYPIIALPSLLIASLALWKLSKTVTQLTHLNFEGLLKN